MKAHPILFSAEMIRALLDCRKTQTRRVVKYQDIVRVTDRSEFVDRSPFDLSRDPTPGTVYVERERGDVVGYRCPYGVPADLLWARETHAIVGTVDPGWVLYRASGYENECRRHRFDHPPPESEITWKPSIHMPRWASRLTLRITNIRVERLQEISEADARAEGVEPLDSSAPENRESCDSDRSLCVKCGGLRLYMGVVNGAAAFDTDCEQCDTHAKRYRWLWESINGPESWQANPWVWAITFEVIKANVDQIMREAA